jgi:hypothetical protein
MCFDDDFFDDFDYKDLNRGGSLLEEVSEEERERRRLEKEMEEIEPPENFDNEEDPIS